LKIGFLNYNQPKIKDIFLKNFDIIIEDDGDFDYINKLMNDLCK